MHSVGAIIVVYLPENCCKSKNACPKAGSWWWPYQLRYLLYLYSYGLLAKLKGSTVQADFGAHNFIAVYSAESNSCFSRMSWLSPWSALATIFS